MKYKVEWSLRAKNRLKKLEKKLAAGVIRKVIRCSENPFLYLKRLRDCDAFRLRVGDFRVILDVDSLNRTLFVLTLGHRKNIYKEISVK